MDITKDKEPESSVLSVEEKERIKAEAAKELLAEEKKQLKDDYKQTVKAQLKRKQILKDAPAKGEGEDLVSVYIDLPTVSECIRLDGRSYYPNRTYDVTPEVQSTLLEIMGRGRDHEESLMDKEGKKNAYRRRSSLNANNHSGLLKH